MKNTFKLLIATVVLIFISNQCKAQSIKDADWWLPRKEIGMRHGFGNVGYSREFTIGYRLDDMWTVGAAISMEKTVGVYTRRYYYFGNRFKFAAYVYGMMGVNVENSPAFVARIEPGVMFRFFNNHQIYMGPGLDTTGFGFHIGFAI